MDRRSARGGDSAGLVTAAVAAGALAAFAGAWFWTRARQNAVDEQTRARLAGGSPHTAPNAAEIHVGTSR